MFKFGDLYPTINIGSPKLTYYIPLESTPNTNPRSLKLKTISDEQYDIYRDHKRIPVLDSQVNLLLHCRGTWELVNDPFDSDFINLSWVGSDTTIIPKRFTTLVLDDKELRDLKPSKVNIQRYIRSSIVNRHILARSKIGTRLVKLTQILISRSSLYSLIRSNNYKNKNKFIPVHFEIDFSESGTEDDLRRKLEKHNNVNIWVVKPVFSSSSVAMKFVTRDDILSNFLSWCKKSYIVNNREVKFSYWMFTEFKQSRLWKLNGTPKSIAIISKYTMRSPFLFIPLCLYTNFFPIDTGPLCFIFNLVLSKKSIVCSNPRRASLNVILCSIVRLSSNLTNTGCL